MSEFIIENKNPRPIVNPLKERADEFIKTTRAKTINYAKSVSMYDSTLKKWKEKIKNAETDEEKVELYKSLLTYVEGRVETENSFQANTVKSAIDFATLVSKNTTNKLEVTSRMLELEELMGKTEYSHTRFTEKSNEFKKSILNSETSREQRIHMQNFINYLHKSVEDMYDEYIKLLEIASDNEFDRLKNDAVHFLTGRT